MPPLPSEATPRSPEDFAPLLTTHEPVLLVGGQAVNVWALYYADRTVEFAPFVSRDVDVLGDRATLADLAKIAGAKPRFFPLKPPSNEVGVVIGKDPQGQPLLIEVLRYVHGVTNDELQHPSFIVDLGAAQVRLPSPIALLQAKAANVADLPQADRQDARHVQILARIMPAYLAEVQAATLQGDIQERALITVLERLLSLVSQPKVKKVLTQLEIPVKALFDGIGHPELKKLQSFLNKRLPRAL